MTVSTPTFDLIFDRVQRKEERLARIARNKERAQAKIEYLELQPQSARRDERIAFIEGVQYARDFRAAGVQEDIEFLDGLLPKDSVTAAPEFTFDEVTGEVNYLTMVVTVTDSPYDDTLFPTGREKGLAFTTSGRKVVTGGSGGAWHRTVGTSERPDADAVSVFHRGSQASAEQWNMGGRFSFTVWDNFGTKENDFKDKAVLFTQDYDPATYFDNNPVIM